MLEDSNKTVGTVVSIEAFRALEDLLERIFFFAHIHEKRPYKNNARKGEKYSGLCGQTGGQFFYFEAKCSFICREYSAITLSRPAVFMRRRAAGKASS